MAQKTRNPSMTAEQIKCILKEVISAYDTPGNQLRLRKIQEDAGDDLVEMMHNLIPAATDIQHKVINNHGFSTTEGVLKFTQMIHFFAEDDPEMAELADQLRKKFIPSMPVLPSLFQPTLTEPTYDIF